MGARRRVESSVVVDVPLDRLWDFLSDTARYDDWVVATLEVTRTDGPAHLGSTYDERNKLIGPIRVTSRWRVIEFDPPRRQVHAAERWPLVKDLHVAFTCEPADAGTRLTQWFEYTPRFGPLGGMLDAAMRGQVQKDLDRTLENCRALAEREAPARV